VIDHPCRVALTERAARAGGAVALDSFRTDLAVETKSGKTDVVTAADRAAQDRVVNVLDGAAPEEPVVGEERVEPRSTDGASGARHDREGGPRKANGEARPVSGARSEPRAEGGVETVPETGSAWIVDPIDGTNNYVRGLRTWATSVAAVTDGEPVAAATVLPALGDAYVAGDGGVRLNDDPVTVSDRTDPETFTVVPTIWWGFDRRDEYAAILEGIVERFGDLRRVGCAQAVLARVADGSLDAAITNVETNPWDTVAGAHLVRQAGGVVTDIEGEPWHHEGRGLVASNGEAHETVLATAREAESR